MSIPKIRIRLVAISISILLLSLTSAMLRADEPERPNILWITSEDNSPQWLGCYGNSQALTPRIDGLARGGVRFTQAYSNAPVCAVARSTLLTGVYAVTQGTQHMRSRNAIPAANRPYVSYLREAGYYCTNNAKTDFNISGNDKSIWDECSNKAHYRNHAEGQPFFSIFNLTISHESSLFPETVKKNRNNGNIPKQSRLKPTDIALPPYVPDLPEIRNDFAIYHDVITTLDTRVGEVLDELQAAGLADDTIVFYYSDHGGPTPRGKRYLENTGVQVPLVIHVPEKWKHLCPFETNSQVDELVSFVDFAPTVLSIIGIDKPTQMPGRAFMGEKRVEPAVDAIVFLYGDRFDDVVGMRRGVTDGRFKYFRCFTPWLPAAPYSYYPLTIPGWKAWQVAASENSLSGYHQKIWETPQPVEYLFDIQNDPWEINNLADDPKSDSQLQKMRKRLMDEMIEVRDTGLVPEGMFEELSNGQPIATFLTETKFDFPAAAKLAFDVTGLSSEANQAIRQNIESDNPVFRYWSIAGCLVHAQLATQFRIELFALISDRHASNRIASSHTLFVSGNRELASSVLMLELPRVNSDASALLLVNTLKQLELTETIPEDLARRLVNDPAIAKCIKDLVAPEANTGR